MKRNLRVRALIIKQLQKSGILFESETYSLKEATLRRVNPTYVIGTSTTVDVSGVDVSKIDDEPFKRTVVKCKKKDEEKLFTIKKQQKELTPVRMRCSKYEE